MSVLPNQLLPTAINTLDLAPSTTGAPVILSSLGVDTSIPILIQPKNNAPISFGGRLLDYVNPVAVTVDAASTLSAAAVLGGLILRSGATAGRIDTLPTAAQLVTAAGGSLVVGSAIPFRLRNASGFTITLAVGTGITAVSGGTLTTATVSNSQYFLVFTNVTPGSEAASLYTLGTGTY